MQTFQRICIEDHSVVDGDKILTLKRGQEYITSPDRGDGTVTVYSNYWGRVPVRVFAGAREFTSGS